MTMYTKYPYGFNNKQNEELKSFKFKGSEFAKNMDLAKLTNKLKTENPFRFFMNEFYNETFKDHKIGIKSECDINRIFLYEAFIDGFIQGVKDRLKGTKYKLIQLPSVFHETWYYELSSLA